MNGKNLNKEQKPIPQLESIYREHWNHARHFENVRLWYTKIYVTALGAIFVFMLQAGYSHQMDFSLISALALFGLILSGMGFLVIIDASLGYIHYITDIVMIYYYWDTMEFYRHPAKPVHFVKLLLYFYEIMTVFFAVLFLFYAPQIWTSLAPFHEHPILICVTFIVIYTGMEGLYQLKWKEYFVENWYFIRILRSDIEGYYWSEWKAWFKDPDFRRKIIYDARKRGILPPP